ncbi:hypothetical protein BOA8489_03454 [Boseongicola aestuarii]|uniref:Uncharacterized protein n=1 Tax=Boseongicola aestuarii TaxID=1470561 RepID=A0A238J591_9RHOB|nr:hypothetical protein BOA8489_03454 [Boseongicola aestuarii]
MGAGRRAFCECCGKIIRDFETFDAIKTRPAAVLLGLLDQRASGGCHQAGGFEIGDQLLVDCGPA